MTAMDSLQEQIGILTCKVEELTHRIEQLSGQMTDVVSECRFGTEQVRRSDQRSMGYRSTFNHSGLEGVSEHKDILLDDDDLDSHRSDRPLAPEIQIQRLTAQLTAAYNRIAALEDQLLSKKRVQH